MVLLEALKELEVSLHDPEVRSSAERMVSFSIPPSGSSVDRGQRIHARQYWITFRVMGSSRQSGRKTFSLRSYRKTLLS